MNIALNHAANGLYAWAAVHAFIASTTSFLWLRQRRADHLAFALASFGLAAYCICAAAATSAESAADAAGALGRQYALGGWVFAALTVLAHLLTGRPASGWVKAVLLGAGLNAALMLSGALVDPATLRVSHHDGGLLVERLPVALTVCASLGTVLGSLIVAQLAGPARRGLEGRLLMAALALPVAGWIVDTGLRLAGAAFPPLCEHLAGIGALGVSYLLMRRAVRSSGELSARTLELRRSYDELRHVNEELVRKEQLAAVGELSAVIAHEVRNPLAALRNAVRTLRRPELGAHDRTTLLGVMDEETDRLNRLVRDLLTYARPVAPQSVRLQLRPLIERAIDRAAGGRTPRVDTLIAVESDVPELEGDSDLLERAFANIAENALEAMPQGGTLSIRVSASDGEKPALVVRFEDTGEGMDTLVRQRARDPFFTTRPSATGLGLAIVERIVRAHGGQIELESRGEEGTTVAVVLPLAEE